MNNEHLNAPKIEKWRSSIENAGCRIHHIRPLQLMHKPNGELLFAMLDIDVSAPDGEKLPRYVFIRGHACIVVVLLRNRDTGEERYLMVKQRRVGHGDVSLEFPAGMLDRDVDNPRSVARRELEEETGLKVNENDITPLCDRPLYSSPGATDEGIYYYGCRIELNADEYEAFEGRIAGEQSENERIQVTLKTREEAESSLMSLQALLGFYLFEGAG